MMNASRTTYDNCCTHGLNFALGRPGSSYDISANPKKTITRHECRFYSYLCNKLRSIVIDKNVCQHTDSAMVDDALEAYNNEKKTHNHRWHTR